jgi:hypothetical protein
MVRSDILHRAIPWTGLMLRERMFRSDLNTRGGNVASVVMAWLIPPALLAAAAVGMIGWIVSGGAVALIVMLNAQFVGAGARAFGWWFAVRAAAFLPVMYFYHGVGLLAGLVTYMRGGSVAARRAPPRPVYRLRDGSSSGCADGTVRGAPR